MLDSGSASYQGGPKPQPFRNYNFPPLFNLVAQPLFPEGLFPPHHSLNDLDYQNSAKAVEPLIFLKVRTILGPAFKARFNRDSKLYWEQQGLSLYLLIAKIFHAVKNSVCKRSINIDNVYLQSTGRLLLQCKLGTDLETE